MKKKYNTLKDILKFRPITYWAKKIKNKNSYLIKQNTSFYLHFISNQNLIHYEYNLLLLLYRKIRLYYLIAQR